MVLEEFFAIGMVVSLVYFPSIEVSSEISYFGVSTTIFPLFKDAFAFVSTIPSSLVLWVFPSITIGSFSGVTSL